VTILKKVDDDVSHMGSLPNLSTPGQVLRITKAIMDRFSQVPTTSFEFTHNSNSADRGDRYTRYSMHRGPVFTR